ncbi:alpha-ketoglutarate-dependent dioxygenase AlkB [Flavobacterium sp. F372]|uniref:Alpha-ketoglutarate-dependent dioxygenase AlkB n=1 Tax=Flavobacterium bernardetii TaxID=2813823 RepID=A0ABR7IXW7_9FLAO|nr:alpha-ketoglutarate-dependent dioxygenase AlkB [Flavobacterium bernardetii]MBC5834629.1 alpha-ketoglutarate-dependent dioxygenase AlkB [Flavobacterium bernardetii]NHF70277.1 alpha-ketoglutarate-dependent dioxygenase AlkB [Flavobacterium bernardetii]
MFNLFPEEPILLNLPDAEFIYYPNFFSKEKADLFFEILLNETPWQHDEITIFGKKILQPRLTSLYGNEGKSYGYSNIVMHPHHFNSTLTFIKEEIENTINENFTTVLLNLYRNEKDSNGWHADNEKELGRDPIIASLSLGEERIFQIKHNTNKEAKQSITLQHGSLLVMKKGAQIHYKHQIPKASKPKNQRINLTFRKII